MPKNGYNTHFKYKFHSEADVAAFFNKAFTEHGIFMSYDVLDPQQVANPSGKNITQVHLRIHLHDLESGEQLSRSMVAQGEDSLDKGILKAVTLGIKYYLLRTFMCTTNTDGDEEPKKKASSETQEQVVTRALEGIAPIVMKYDKEKGKSLRKYLDMGGHSLESLRETFDKADELIHKAQKGDGNELFD